MKDNLTTWWNKPITRGDCVKSSIGSLLMITVFAASTIANVYRINKARKQETQEDLNNDSEID